MKKIVLAAGIILAIAVAIFFIARPKQNTVSSSQPRLSASTQNRITIGGKSWDSTEASNIENSSSYKPLMNEMLTSKISLRHLSHIKRRGNQQILVFKDGSEMYITNYVKEQLSDEILFRLDLSSNSVRSRHHVN